MAQKEANGGKSAPFDWKTVLYGASIMVSLIGSFGLLIFTFLIYDSLDKTESLALANIDGVQSDLGGVEQSLVSAEAEISSANSTLDDVQSSLVPLSAGLEDTGSSIDSIAAAISGLPVVGSSIPTSGLADASASLKDSGTRLANATSGLEANKATMGGLLAGVETLRASVHDQESTLAQTRSSLEDVFGLMKIASVLFFFVALCVFTTIGMNSVAGLV